jgi:hypothetical protein
MSEHRLPEGLAIKRVGQVEIVEMFRHSLYPYRPARHEKKPLLLRKLLRKLCKLFRRFCFGDEEPVVDYRVVEDVILKTFGTNYKYYVFVSDMRYRLPSIGTVRKFLEDDKTDELNYILDFADCDDYAFALQGAQERHFWGKGYAFGILWYYNERFGHAVNFFIDRDKQLWIVEPQNDSILKWCSNQDYCGYPFVIII